jgi:hypothetical protein
MKATRIVLVAFAAGLGASSVQAAPLTAALEFVGINPCRIIDTRAAAGFTGQYGPPALVANADRTFQITGTTTGTPAQCGIPDAAVAISANFTVTAFTAAGDIRAFPAGSAAPLTSVLNFSLENIANATSLPLGPSGGGHNGITVHADVSATELIVDVNGYYVPAGILASGETETGIFSGYITAAGATNIWIPLQLPKRLTAAPAAPNANFIPVAGPATANCPGTALNPTAAPGQFCVYAGSTCPNVTLQCIAGHTGSCGGVGLTSGGILAFNVTGAGVAYCIGAWAVTAP